MAATDATSLAPAPLVTVIVRSMDRPQLPGALASLAAQDHPAIEVLVVDATGGRHAPPVSPLTTRGHSIRLVSSGQRLPRAQAADLGLVSASGEWFTFLDDDDTCAPTHISGLVAAAAATPEALVVYGCARVLGTDGALEEVYGRPFNRALMHFGPLLQWQASLIRTRVRELGCRFDPAFEVCEDRDFLAQVAMHGEFVFASHLATFNFRPDLGTSGTGTGPNRDHARAARFDRLLRAKWAGASTWHAERSFVQCRRGARALNAGDLARAQEEFAHALAQYPEDPNALHGLARVALARGDRLEAERFARRAIAVNPRIGAFRETLAATGARAEAFPASRVNPVSRMAACPCGSGRKFKVCCGRFDASSPTAEDPVAQLCAQARKHLDAGDAATAFDALQRASAIRCDSVVLRLLEACSERLVEHEAEASLWSMVRSVCAAAAEGAACVPVRSVVVVGGSAREGAAQSAMQRLGVAGEDVALSVADSLEGATVPMDDATCVVFCHPDDVPLHGVPGPGPGRALLLGDDEEAGAVLRALARVAEGWPRARLDYLGVSL